MPSTFLSLHYHTVFSTKKRAPLIVDSWRERLHEYLNGTVVGLGGTSNGAGGVADHVHLLVGLRATHCLAHFMRELKRSSSVWVRDELKVREFAWQEGYGAFTVSPTACTRVEEYIRNQADHHRVKTFQEELRAFLKQAGVKYEDRFLE